MCGSSNHHQDLDIKIVHIAMDACWDDRRKLKIYNEKIHKHAHSVQNPKVIRTCLACGKIFENVRFPKEMRQNLPFIEKYATVSFHIYR